MHASLIVSIVISWVVALYVGSRRPAPGAKQLAWMMGMVGMWGLPFLLRALDASAPVRLLALKLEYLSIVSVPLLWLCFALSYTGKGGWFTRKRLALLLLMPGITLALALAAEHHNLIVDFSDAPLDATGLAYVNWKRGMWGWVNTYYQYGVLIFGTCVLLRGLARLHLSYRSQVIPLVVTLIIGWGVNILYAVELIPSTWPVAPLSFAFFGLGITWSLYRHRLLDIVPVARNVLVEEMSDAVFVLDTQKRVVDVNPAGQQLLGRATGALIGQPIAQVLPDLDELFPVQVDAPVRGGIALGSDHDAARIYDARVSALHGRRQEHTTGYLCVLRDVTDLERAREQAQAADQAKSEFLSNVSHELRTPLTSVKLYLDLLHRGREERQQDYLATIGREVVRLQTLIEGVLTISRLDLGKLRPDMRDVDLNALLHTLYQDRRVLFEKRGLALDVEIEPELPPVKADPRLMEQVITNLLTNAMNYTPHGGAVHLSTMLIMGSQATWAALAVQDTGLGISPEEQPRIFERFRRGAASQATQTPGTGLGLAICQEIVNLHQGYITLESELGQGSTFTVWLPVM